MRNITEGSFDLSTGGIDTPSGTMEDITPRILSEGKYSAILFPGNLGAYAEGWVEISAGGKTSVYKAPATIGESSVLESGKETVLNVLNLRLKSDGDIGTDPDPDPDPDPDTDYSGRTCWVYGVKTASLPDYPKDSESVPEYNHLFPENFPDGIWYKVSDITCLNWQEGFLWSDCDKDASWIP